MVPPCMYPNPSGGVGGREAINSDENDQVNCPKILQFLKPILICSGNAQTYVQRMCLYLLRIVSLLYYLVCVLSVFVVYDMMYLSLSLSLYIYMARIC